MSVADLRLPFIRAADYGPTFSQAARIRVIHSTEGPMSVGNAAGLARNWFGRPASQGGAGTSAHDIFDPADGVMMVPADHIAWHVGPGANGFTRGSEHCGSVNLTREEWLSPNGQSMLDRSARYNAAACVRDGVQPRWLTLTQLAARQSGFCTHNDIRLVFGGTTHSDPGPNFPYGWYMDRVRFYYDDGGDEWEGIMAASADELLAELKGLRADLNRQASGMYETMVRPDPAHESGSVKGTNNRLDEVQTLLTTIAGTLDDIAGKLAPGQTP